MSEMSRQQNPKNSGVSGVYKQVHKRVNKRSISGFIDQKPYLNLGTQWFLTKSAKSLKITEND